MPNQANSELDKKLGHIRKWKEQKFKDLQNLVTELLIVTEKLSRKVIERAGHKWCDKCDGTGAIERLDSGYMKRFGLREWDGCPDCGGEGEKRGRGYHD